MNTSRCMPNYPKFQLGMIVEGCNLHIGPIIDFAFDDSVVIRSLFTDEESIHSIKHCGVEIQCHEDTLHKLALFTKGGMAAIKEHWDKRCAELSEYYERKKD